MKEHRKISQSNRNSIRHSSLHYPFPPKHFSQSNFLHPKLQHERSLIQQQFCSEQMPYCFGSNDKNKRLFCLERSSPIIFRDSYNYRNLSLIEFQEKKIKELVRQIKELKKKLHRLKKANAGWVTFKKRKKLSSTEERVYLLKLIEKLQFEKGQIVGEIEDFVIGPLKEAEELINEHRIMIDAMQLENSELKSSNLEFERQLKIQSYQEEQEYERNSINQEIVENLSSQIEKLGKSNLDLELRLKKSQKEIFDLERGIFKSKTDNKIQQTENNQLKAKNSLLRDEVQQLKSSSMEKMKSLIYTNEKLKHENSNIKAKFKEFSLRNIEFQSSMKKFSDLSSHLYNRPRGGENPKTRVSIRKSSFSTIDIKKELEDKFEDIVKSVEKSRSNSRSEKSRKDSRTRIDLTQMDRRRNREKQMTIIRPKRLESKFIPGEALLKIQQDHGFI